MSIKPPDSTPEPSALRPQTPSSSEQDTKTGRSNDGITAHTPPRTSELRQRSSISRVAPSILTNASSAEATGKPIKATTNITPWQRICNMIRYLFCCCFRSRAKVQPQIEIQQKPSQQSIDLPGVKLDASDKIKESIMSTLAGGFTPVGNGDDYKMPTSSLVDVRRCGHLEISIKGNDSITEYPEDSEIIKMRQDISRKLGDKGTQIYDNLMVLLSQANSVDIAIALAKHYPVESYQTANISTLYLEPENQGHPTQYRRIDIDHQSIIALNLQLFKVNNAPSGKSLEERYIVVIDKTIIPREVMSSNDIVTEDFSQAKKTIELTRSFSSEKEALTFMDNELQKVRKEAAQKNRQQQNLEKLF